jgi:hypothetical protein
MLKFSYLILPLCLLTSIYADDGFDDEGGFDDELIEVVQTQKADNLSIYGWISSGVDYSYEDKHKISSGKLSTNIKIDYLLNNKYKIKSTTKAYIDSQTSIKDDHDFDINELTIEGSLESGIDWKIGRQIVVWGKSDNIRITDTINPLDSTTPGMTDIEDLRLGRVISKLDKYIGEYRLSAMILHENRYSMIPEVGSDYYNPMITRSVANTPSNSIENSGFALSLSGNFEGEDVAFYALNDYMDNKSYRSNMLGFAYNKVIDSYLLKTEMAYFDNYDTSIVDSKIDSLIGVEYNGIDDGSISFELANKNNTIEYAIRFTQSYINQTLDFTALYSGVEKDLSGGDFIRMWFDYDVDDHVSTTWGTIMYNGGTNIIRENIKNNDRLFVSIKYNF